MCRYCAYDSSDNKSLEGKKQKMAFDMSIPWHTQGGAQQYSAVRVRRVSNIQKCNTKAIVQSTRNVIKKKRENTYKRQA